MAQKKTTDRAVYVLLAIGVVGAVIYDQMTDKPPPEPVRPQANMVFVLDPADYADLPDQDSVLVRDQRGKIAWRGTAKELREKMLLDSLAHEEKRRLMQGIRESALQGLQMVEEAQGGGGGKD